MNENIAFTRKKNAFSNRILPGAVLILLGVIFLAGQLFELPSFGQLFLPGLGVIFLLWGILSRNSGLLIPGGVLAGIGTGVYLMKTLPLEDAGPAGIFLVSFGAGFGLTALLSFIFTPEKHVWALWPAGILALIGGLMIAGGPALTVLQFIGRYWPVALIVIGIYIVINNRKSKIKDPSTR